MDRCEIELLSPAGNFDCAIAAFYYGADAVYLGLKQFSARADATNFSNEELFDIVRIAHGLDKKVYVAINTLIQNSEIQKVANQLSIIESANVDGVIVQDFGVISIIKKYFPKLSLHASTQMAVHNLDGALSLKELGFSRVVLARELTFDEIKHITEQSGMEIEVFIHGALCYSYSGLCMYSSFETGHSANRGSCLYPCRKLCGLTHPYSMKDLSLGDYILKLKDIGVASLKIEGRKKSSLYVAATTDYYNKILTNQNTNDCLKNIQKIFARPYTNLNFNGKRDDVIDKYFCGPRGVLIGYVEKIRNNKIRFKTTEHIEKYDGILITIKNQEKPFGFSVDKMFINNKFVFAASKGDTVELKLPDKYPNINIGDAIYCSSSNKIKSIYPVNLNILEKKIVKPSIDITFEITRNFMKVSGKNVESILYGNFVKSDNPEIMKQGVYNSFSKLGNSNYKLGYLDYKNSNYFAPISLLNNLRRNFVDKLNNSINSACSKTHIDIDFPFVNKDKNPTGYVIKIDNMSYLDSFLQQDINDISEIIIDINCDLSMLRIPLEKIRIYLPIINRDKDNFFLKEKIESVIKLGITKFSISNIYGLNLLKEFGIDDFICDFYMYSMNTFAVDFLIQNGAKRVTISPEDNIENIKSILNSTNHQIDLIVYSDIPLFISDNPVEYDKNVKLTDEIVFNNCNYIFGKYPYCIIEDAENLCPTNFRLDFCFKRYSPEYVHKIYTMVRLKKSSVHKITKANLNRGFCV